MNIIIASIDHDFTVAMAVVVVVTRCTTPVYEAASMHMVIMAIHNDFVAMAAASGAAAKSFVWEEVGKCTTSDMSNTVGGASAEARIDCATIHMDVVVVSVDDNLVVMAVPVMIVTLTIWYVHYVHVEI